MLYVAFYAHDSRPETILSQQTQRGGDLARDDFVSILIDPSRRQVDHYEFQVSANGTQNDSFPGSGSTNYAWRGDWAAAAARVDDGYTVELAIPLRILRYPKGQTEFGIAFHRNLEREEETAYWPLMHNRLERRLMAVLGPLTLKPITLRPAILPYVLGRLGGHDAFGVQAGLDVKHTFDNGLTALYTLNPDFRTIEDVVETIAFSYTDRQLSETRPFFKEGSGYYPDWTAWYTRRIPDVTTGLKLFGRQGQHEFGSIAVLSDRGRVDGAFDYTWRPTPNHSVGTGLVYREDGPTPTNLVSASHIDGFHPFGAASLSYGADFYHSSTGGPYGEGNRWAVFADWGGEGVLGCEARYTLNDPTFTPLDGFVGEPDTRGWRLSLDGGRWHRGGFIQLHDWYGDVEQYRRQDGSLLERSAELSGSIRLRNGTRPNLRLFVAERPPNHDATFNVGLDRGLETLFEEGGFDVTFGRRGGADYVYATIDQGWSPLRGLRLGGLTEYTYRYFDAPGFVGRRCLHLTQTVGTATYELSPYSTLSARLVERDGALNLFVAWRNAPLSGRGLYLFFGDPNALRTEVSLSVKTIWPF